MKKIYIVNNIFIEFITSRVIAANVIRETAKSYFLECGERMLKESGQRFIFETPEAAKAQIIKMAEARLKISLQKAEDSEKFLLDVKENIEVVERRK